MVTTITAIGVSAVGVIADVSPNSHGSARDQHPVQHGGRVADRRAHRLCGGPGASPPFVWAIGSHSSNPHLAGRGKSGVLVAFVAAVLIGGANVLVDFFVTTGKGI